MEKSDTKFCSSIGPYKFWIVNRLSQPQGKIYRLLAKLLKINNGWPPLTAGHALVPSFGTVVRLTLFPLLYSTGVIFSSFSGRLHLYRPIRAYLNICDMHIYTRSQSFRGHKSALYQNPEIYIYNDESFHVHGQHLNIAALTLLRLLVACRMNAFAQWTAHFPAHWIRDFWPDAVGTSCGMSLATYGSSADRTLHVWLQGGIAELVLCLGANLVFRHCTHFQDVALWFFSDWPNIENDLLSLSYVP